MISHDWYLLFYLGKLLHYKVRFNWYFVVPIIMCCIVNNGCYNYYNFFIFFLQKIAADEQVIGHHFWLCCNILSYLMFCFHAHNYNKFTSASPRKKYASYAVACC